MAKDQLKTFLEKSKDKVEDAKHRQTINFNMTKYHASVANGMNQYSNHELARQRGSYFKGNAN